jgi:hypothetical protein
MRITLLILSLAGLALASDPARVTSPVLGYVFDPASKSMRLIAGIPGAAALEAAVPSASKIENGFVSQNHRYLIATTLDGVLLLDLERLSTQRLEGAPADAGLAAWSSDGTAVAFRSNSGEIQLWTGFPKSASFRFSVAADSPAGLSVADDGRSVLYWNDTGLYSADGGSVRQLISEQVNSAAYRPGTDDWAAVTGSQLLRSNGEPLALPVTKAKSVSFTSKGILIGGEKAIGLIDNSGSRTIACDCDATATERLAGTDVFRLTGLDAASLAIYDGDSAEPQIFYIPTEGGRR